MWDFSNKNRTLRHIFGEHQTFRAWNRGIKMNEDDENHDEINDEDDDVDEEEEKDEEEDEEEDKNDDEEEDEKDKDDNEDKDNKDNEGGMEIKKTILRKKKIKIIKIIRNNIKLIIFIFINI